MKRARDEVVTLPAPGKACDFACPITGCAFYHRAKVQILNERKATPRWFVPLPPHNLPEWDSKNLTLLLIGLRKNPHEIGPKPAQTGQIELTRTDFLCTAQVPLVRHDSGYCGKAAPFSVIDSTESHLSWPRQHGI